MRRRWSTTLLANSLGLFGLAFALGVASDERAPASKALDEEIKHNRHMVELAIVDAKHNEREIWDLQARAGCKVAGIEQVGPIYMLPKSESGYGKFRWVVSMFMTNLRNAITTPTAERDVLYSMRRGFLELTC